MEAIGGLLTGFGIILTLDNLFLCFLGSLIGTLVGVLPGVGPLAALALLLPITFTMTPVGGMVMLASIFYGAMYGGSTTSILVNIPGEATSVVTCLDGHQMAKQGRAGVALGISAIGSFIAGCVSTVIIAALAAPLTRMALLFGPADYFALMVLGLMFAVVLARGSVGKAIAIILVGLLHGPRERRGALDVRLERDCRRHRCGRHRHGHVRLCRDHAQPRDDADP